jgi:hypothetical protein
LEFINMGTSLTGLTPATTYDALIKVGDNGPLSATAKVLSDGLGNNSPLAMSTTLVGIGTGTPYTSLTIGNTDATAEISSGGANTHLTLKTVGASGALRFFTIGGGTNTLATTESMRITSAGNVGIGTSSPTQKLDVAGRITAAGNDYHALSVDQGSAQLRLERTGTSTGVNYIGSDNAGLKIFNSSFSTLATFTANGLTFNGDTAAANALDDYEEGTWTMGVSFGGASVGVTYNGNTGTYTKIGRQVTVSGYIALSNKGSSTGSARVTGLPFTSLSGDSNLTAVTLWYNNTTFVGQFQGLVRTGQNYIDLTAITELGVIASMSNTNFADNTEILLNVTYFV